MSGDYVRLDCGPQTLETLASGLSHYAPAGGQPEWLVTGAWLCTARARYIVTATIKVLPDGFVARGLQICRPEDLTRHIEAELGDVAGRLTARGNGMTLPPVGIPSPPQHLNRWSEPSYETKILVRASERAAGTNHVACGILFASADRSLLVGSDPSTLALVLGDDPQLIERYCSGCVALTPAEYLLRG